MDFFFYDPFDDLSKIQSHLAQLQREMDTTQQQRRRKQATRGMKKQEEGEGKEAKKEDELKIEHSPARKDDNDEKTIGIWWPAVDVRETERGYELYVELPGVKKEDVKIELHKEGSGKCLVVSGKKERFVLPPPEEKKEKMEDEKEEKKKEFEVWHRTERAYGRFERAFSVPVETEGEEIKAKFENGVLAVSFPKHEALKTPAKVAIQID